jgi:hypothetical protein
VNGLLKTRIAPRLAVAGVGLTIISPIRTCPRHRRTQESCATASGTPRRSSPTPPARRSSASNGHGHGPPSSSSPSNAAASPSPSEPPSSLEHASTLTAHAPERAHCSAHADRPGNAAAHLHEHPSPGDRRAETAVEPTPPNAYRRSGIADRRDSTTGSRHPMRSQRFDVRRCRVAERRECLVVVRATVDRAVRGRCRAGAGAHGVSAGSRGPRWRRHSGPVAAEGSRPDRGVSWIGVAASR